MRYLFSLILLFSINYAKDFYYEFDKKIELEEIKQTKSNNSILQYKTNEGKIVKFKNEIIVSCKENSSCEDVFLSFDIQNYKELSKNFYLIGVEENQNIFELCQKLYENSNISLAHPNFIKQRVFR